MSSATIMGLDTHMILETVPVPRSPRRTAHYCINRSSRHYARPCTQRAPDIGPERESRTPEHIYSAL